MVASPRPQQRSAKQAAISELHSLIKQPMSRHEPPANAPTAQVTT